MFTQPNPLQLLNKSKTCKDQINNNSLDFSDSYFHKNCLGIENPIPKNKATLLQQQNMNAKNFAGNEGFTNQFNDYSGKSSHKNIDMKCHLVSKYKHFIQQVIGQKLLNSLDKEIQKKIISKSCVLENKLTELSTEIAKEAAFNKSIYSQHKKYLDQKEQEIEIANIQSNNSKANLVASSLMLKENKEIINSSKEYYSSVQELQHILSNFEEEKDKLFAFIIDNFKFPNHKGGDLVGKANGNSVFQNKFKDEVKSNTIQKLEIFRNLKMTKVKNYANAYLKNSSLYLDVITKSNEILKKSLNQN